MDNNVLSEQAAIKHLWNSTQKIQHLKSNPNVDRVINNIRYNCVTLIAIAEEHSNHFPLSEVCKYCGTPWAEGMFVIKVSGPKQHMKKLKKRLEAKSDLSYAKKKLVTFFNKRKDNVLVKSCLVCNKVTKHEMKKPFKRKEDVNVIPDLTHNSNELLPFEKKKHKRKSKKQSFAGLSPAAVLQARLSLSQNSSNIEKYSTPQCKKTSPVSKEKREEDADITPDLTFSNNELQQSSEKKKRKRKRKKQSYAGLSPAAALQARFSLGLDSSNIEKCSTPQYKNMTPVSEKKGNDKPFANKIQSVEVHSSSLKDNGEKHNGLQTSNKELKRKSSCLESLQNTSKNKKRKLKENGREAFMAEILNLL